MGRMRWQAVTMQAGVGAVLVAGACAATPIVKPTCTISWERSADFWRVDEYRLTASKMVEGASAEKITMVVKAPKTQVSCHDAGARSEGKWQVVVQACLKDGTCSQAGKPLVFTIVAK